MDFDPADRPHQILDSNGVIRCYVVMFLKEMVIQSHTPTTCRNSKILGVMFSFGAIGAWSKAQRAEWQCSALHVVDTVATPVSATSFNVFKQTTSVLLPSESVFFLVVEVFHHKRANLEPYKD